MDSQIRYQFADLEHLALAESQARKLDEEIKSIKLRFSIPIFGMADETQVRQYVRFHQYSLVRLMDQIGASSKYQQLNNLLEFLASDFTEFYDVDSKAPDQMISAAKRNSKKQVAKLTDLLIQRSVDRYLIEVCLLSISRLEKEYRNLPVSFRRISFANEVEATMYELVDTYQNDLEEQLELMLFYLNCNSIRVFLYQTQLLQKRISVVDSNIERIEKLSYALKRINQIQVRQGIGYNVKGTSLKDLVSDYVNEELSYLERMRLKPAGVSPGERMIQEFRLRFNLSVSQVAYVFRIFIENQLIQTKNQTELLKFLSQILVTKKAESVSFDSLRAKYYNIETGTKESVRETLNSLIRYVDKN